MALENPGLLVIFLLVLSMSVPLLYNLMVRAEWSLSIFPRHFIASGTRALSLSYRFLVSITLSLNGFNSSLSGGTVAVRVNGFLSNLHSINAGVPHGSVISPVLFIPFINDLLSSTSPSIHSFADDTFLSSSFLFDSHDHAHGDIPLHAIISASLLINDGTVIRELEGEGVKTTYFRSIKARRHRLSLQSQRSPDFPTVFMHDCELNT